jgi:aryl-alcohol dehydrogenase-like predicted oxidoreductase
MLDAGERQDFSPQHLRAALELSLRRLRTDYLDLLQLHSPSLEALRSAPEILGALEQLRREGKIRAHGLSARSPDDALAAVREFGFPCVQVNFSLADQRALDNGLLESCRESGTGVIARTPLCFGFLTGKYSAATAFPASDHRNRWSSEQRTLWADAPGTFAAALGSAPSQTPAQLALRFCLSFDAVSAAIPGMQKVSEVEENAQASDLGALGPQEREALRDTYRKHRFFLDAT